jgi:hypothetical protein
MLLAEKNAMIEEIELLVEKYGRDRSALLSILHDIQKNTGIYLIMRSRKLPVYSIYILLRFTALYHFMLSLILNRKEEIS